MSEQDRLAAERAIACQLLPVTYDGSPLVRAELAAALARLATGHVVLFKVCAALVTCHVFLVPMMVVVTCVHSEPDDCTITVCQP